MTLSAKVIASPFKQGSIEFSSEAVLRDFRIGWRSRHVSVLGRKEVLSGKAKFGIFGDGKEVAQLAMAYAFERGDVRAGYYRDQTLLLALGITSVEQFFAQLYAHADLDYEPAFGGRSMTGHFATRYLDDQGRFLPQTDRYNSAADLSPTASQMPKLVGLSYASKLYREHAELAARAEEGFSREGREIAFGTIGNASCAEGMFWESVNAVGVLQAPMLLSIWDDGFGISVPNKYQMTKGDVSTVLSGFKRRAGGRPGFDIYTVPGWDYARLCETYLRASQNMRRDHVPVIVHVTELTQPLGHSTSGSHERYKTEARLSWEEDFDCLVKMREWIEREGLATPAELDQVIDEEEARVKEAMARARTAYREPIETEKAQFLELAEALLAEGGGLEELTTVIAKVRRQGLTLRRHLLAATQQLMVATRHQATGPARENLLAWRRARLSENEARYSSHLYSEGAESALAVPPNPPVYSSDPKLKNGYEILNACFDAALARVPHLFAMGEDVGNLGDVNQAFSDLQDRYGELRVADTGIRETTILGQAIGMALRGLRPIAEIQYLDYILYALQYMSDELATLQWRTKGGQKAPVIIRTRGHRLEGIWHSGSPMAGILNLCRGIYVCVPRDATRAVGFYNTLLASDDCGLIVEVLNGYRKKAPMPDNVGEVRIPLGEPEILRAGSDLTLVTYGACCELALEAADMLASTGIEAEVIDVQTLLPFDRTQTIRASIEKTNRVLFLDEDVPGGTTAYMMQQVLERDGAWQWLDAPPATLAAQAHRPAYGSDGDYFSKPSRDDIFNAAYELMAEGDPSRFPSIF